MKITQEKPEGVSFALQVIGAYSAVKEAEDFYQFFVEAKAESHNILYTNPATKRISVSPANLTEAWEEFLKLPEGVSFLNQIMAIHPPSVYYNCMKAVDETIAAIDKEYK